MLLSLDELVWPPRHQPVFAVNGVVVTSQPLAAGVGVEIMRDGGTAVWASGDRQPLAESATYGRNATPLVE